MKYLGQLSQIVMLLSIFQLGSCQNTLNVGPGYNFNLFKQTPVTSLAAAVEIEDIQSIRKLVNIDLLPINFRDSKFGNSLLTLAIVNNKKLSTETLLNLRADPNIRSFDNSSPFLQACLYSNQLPNSNEILNLLIKHGGDVNTVQTDTTLDQFGKKKHFQTTALRTAIIYGNLSTVKVLVENGANLNIGSNEHSILTSAVLSDKLDILKYLMIDKMVPIPDYCVIRQKGNRSEKRMTIADLLNEQDFTKDPQKQRLKNEIMNFLKSNVTNRH